MPDGRVVWLYGDTLVTVGGARWMSAHSTAITQTGSCLHISMRGAQVLPDESTHDIYWIQSAVALDSSHLLIAAARQRLGNCPFCFVQTGTRAAVVSLDSSGDLRFQRWLDYWPQGAVSWGAGMVLVGPTLVVYGTRASGHRYVFGRSVFAARVPLTQIRHRHAWVLARRPVIAAKGGTDMTITAWHDPAGFHLVSKQDGMLGDAVREWDAAEYAGRFRSQLLLAGLAPHGHHYAYSAAAHPEQRLAHGRLLITVARNYDGTKTVHLSAFRASYTVVTPPLSRTG